MSVEAAHRPEAPHDEEKIRAVEIAVESIAKLRTLIAEIEQRLSLERAAKKFDAAMVEYLEKRLQELADELQDSLAFLEEFDPVLHQKLKDNS